ncbi:hypothetical protein PN465_11540 [Nodularia spumigena CS-584]|jgi:hypothetical protein|uniref:Uncharacterized protein n=1 Tax=Nodularia spumigena UHCC 0060 TaxID=3110300 RepID=A0ABU5ULB0_NODSP|nr:hypothetical protein [Nodularia spumigena]AHJ28939.1 hypothetical protein NSP_26110 [Nodularia spumigena CCY9414]EAW45366.1 hypothetical protein N9414_20580 [Nodularia spumigena CCY9414]MDB9382849.1 hypothetical protein [Nodularia spumigena CS-584]MEA5525266.1 hypothetical protein [Nodularia spumigena UHCC 0143]MEA5557019.1 hypothetical protein [Nodularia spumigena CH309]
MSVEPILLKKIAEDRNFSQVTISEVKPEQMQQDGLDIPDIALTLSPVALLFSWVVFFLLLQKVRTLLDNKMVFTVNGSHKVPCKNCRFYSNNHYLKCAVQPSIVLTEEAKDCPEYSPKNGKFSPNSLFK